MFSILSLFQPFSNKNVEFLSFCNKKVGFSALPALDSTIILFKMKETDGELFMYPNLPDLPDLPDYSNRRVVTKTIKI